MPGRDLAHRHRLGAHRLGERAAVAQPAAGRDVDRARHLAGQREALLHRIQQLIYDKSMYLPLWQIAALSGYGPRVAESGLGLILDYPWAAPYEEVKLKAK